MDINNTISIWSIITRNYFSATRTAVFAQLATLMIIVFGNTDGVELAVAVAVVAVGVFGLMACDDALRHLNRLQNDIDDSASSSALKSLKSSPLPLFRVASAIAFVAVAIAQLIALY